MYQKYWTEEAINEKFKSGLLILDYLRINIKNYEEAFVPHHDGQTDIFIDGIKYRNRALNGDLVYIEVFMKEQWKLLLEDLVSNEDDIITSLKLYNNSENEKVIQTSELDINEKFEERFAPTGGQSNPTDNALPKHKNIRKFHKNGTVKKTDNEKVNISRFITINDLIFSKSSLISGKLLNKINSFLNRCSNKVETLLSIKSLSDIIIRTGHVVGIAEEKHSRCCVGKLKLLNDKNTNFSLFSPTDSRMPRILIPAKLCPENFFNNSNTFKETLFACKIVDWKENSIFPLGEILQVLGKVGNLEAETAGILIEHNINFDIFPEKISIDLKKLLPFKIPNIEWEKRKIFTDKCVFTIDPETAKDLDDAVSCELIEEGLYEIGVHIADVSYFVLPNSDLDNIASKRGTSVYMVQKVIPMLPNILSEELCSLNPGEDKLTFSVVWKITEDGDVLDEWFGKTIIRSCIKLSYNDAQQFIDKTYLESSSYLSSKVSGSFNLGDISKRVSFLHIIASKLQKKRFDNGALKLNNVKIQFYLNPENKLPQGCSVNEIKDSHKLIEEFMLLANMAVARKIHNKFPNSAILRRHPPPQQKCLNDVIKMCKILEIKIDATSSGSLQKSINFFSKHEKHDSISKTNIIMNIFSKPMQNAKYFCSGLYEESCWFHYALNVPLYTHFTSPIRRYPDIMVHRHLAASLNYIDSFFFDPKIIENHCKHCNDTKLESKKAQEKSIELFFSAFIEQCGPLDAKGMVMCVLDHSFDVFLIDYGFIKRIYCEKLSLLNYNYERKNNIGKLILIWNYPEKNYEKLQEVTIFTNVLCCLTSNNNKLNVLIKPPNETE